MKRLIPTPRLSRRASPALNTALTISLLALGTLAGCHRDAAPAAAPPPPSVSVIRPLQREVVDWDVYTGRLAAPEVVEVRARVSGFIERVPFAEGAMVQPGDLLYVIDVRPYQAELSRALAELARAQAQQRFAASDWQRIERLASQQAAAELEIMQTRASAEQANAAVAAAEAAVQTARLNVEWCQVTAPIAGRVGRRLVTVGNLINGGQGQATLLTTITSLDPIYCYVDIDERSVRRYQRLVREGARPSARQGGLRVELALVDETEFRHQGYIDFVDNRLDPGTGTISVRAVFANPGGQMLPGFFARLRFPGRGAYHTTLVPEEAIGTNLAQQYVLIVGENDKVVLRPVTPGKTFFGLREVDGVTPDDRVLVKGLVQARPGSKVRPELVPLEVAQTRPESRPGEMQMASPSAHTKPEDAARLEPTPSNRSATAPAEIGKGRDAALGGASGSSSSEGGSRGSETGADGP